MSTGKFSKLNDITLKNKKYRKHYTTIGSMQLVLMSLKASQDVPKERHPGITQFIHLVNGLIEVTIGKKKKVLKSGDSAVVPPGVYHYIKNIHTNDSKLYTIYSPSEND